MATAAVSAPVAATAKDPDLAVLAMVTAELAQAGVAAAAQQIDSLCRAGRRC